MLAFERQAWSTGFSRVAGLDEAGRGPLAGPVVAAAVYLPRSFLEEEAESCLAGLNDSKQISPSRRDAWYQLLTGLDVAQWAVGEASVEEIDRLNILRATHLAMARALGAMSDLPGHVLVDGLPVPGLPCSSTPVVKGDAKSLLMAAASIVAKVHRDRIMVKLDTRYPGYGLARHKGYGTPQHLEALSRLGPSACHRHSFAPVAKMKPGPEG